MRTPSLFVFSCLLCACGGSRSSSPAHEPVEPHTAHEQGHGNGHEGHGHGNGHGQGQGQGQGHEHGGMHAGHSFEHAEEWVKRFEGPERDAWQKPELVVQAMAIRPGMVVADIGAGTGYFLPHLVRATGPKGKVLGIDLEPDMVRYMNERIERDGLEGASAQACSADDPSLAPASTDRILIVDTWHHISDRSVYAGKLGAALRAGGQLYIVDFTLESPHGPPAEMRLSPEAVIAELRAGGIIAERIEVALPNQWVVRGHKAP